jgi:hypothetical protein
VKLNYPILHSRIRSDPFFKQNIDLAQLLNNALHRKSSSDAPDVPMHRLEICNCLRMNAGSRRGQEYGTALPP